MRRNRLAYLLAVLTATSVVVLSGWSAILSEPFRTSAPPSTDKGRSVVNELAPENIAKLHNIISRLRDLEFKTPVTVDNKDRDELKKKMVADTEKNAAPEETAKLKKALLKFGLVPPELDLDNFMTDLYTEQIAGYYDSETKELYTISSGGTESAAEEQQPKDLLGIPWERLTVIHEMTHALQDQHFDLLSLPMDSMLNDDIATAVKSLVEGEATFVMYDYILRQRGMNMILTADMSESAEEKIQGANPSLIDQAPLYIKEGMLFPYLKGVEFIKFVKSREGWPAIDGMYADLPASTEQILHPQKYLLESRDYPTTITFPDFKDILPPDKWQLLLQNVIGELNVDVLMRQFLPTLKTERIAAGWDGDAFTVCENKDSKQVLLIWFVTWDTTRDAREFFTAYTKLLERKYKSPAPLKKESALRLWSDASGLIQLERRDQDVLIIEGVNQDLLNVLSETIWQQTKKSELKEIKRIDPAKRKKEQEKEEKEKKDE
jgi:hypothetical protein